MRDQETESEDGDETQQQRQQHIDTTKTEPGVVLTDCTQPTQTDRPQLIQDHTESTQMYLGEGHWTTLTESIDLDQKEVKLETMSTLERLSVEIENEDIMKAHLVNQRGYPNRFGARIPVFCKWNLDLLEDKLVDYHDKEVVEWMRFGWPTGRLPTQQEPVKTFRNHKGATEFPQALKDYVTKEMDNQAVSGPWERIPFSNGKVGISPLSTRPKKDTDERRIIVDLSFPPGRGGE